MLMNVNKYLYIIILDFLNIIISIYKSLFNKKNKINFKKYFNKNYNMYYINILVNI